MTGSAPFDVDLVVQRLRAELGDVLQQVRGAADYAAIQGMRDFRPPEVFALLIAERDLAARAGAGGQAAPSGRARQAVQVEFGLVLAVRNARYQRGAPAVQDAMPLIGAVRDALIGWIPPGLPMARPVTWQRGRVLDYDAGTLLWTDIFTTQHSIGRTP